MNQELQALFNRLQEALDKISRYPKTAVEVSLLTDELVETLEEIVADLIERSDEQVSKDLQSIITQS